MRHKLRQPANRRRYARRTAIVEPVFGQLKADRGFTTLSVRGLMHAKAEERLGGLAHNLGKLLRVCPLPAVRPMEVATAVVGPLPSPGRVLRRRAGFSGQGNADASSATSAPVLRGAACADGGSNGLIQTRDPAS